MVGGLDAPFGCVLFEFTVQWGWLTQHRICRIQKAIKTDLANTSACCFAFLELDKSALE
ncbi:hypothetical protein PAUR_a2004 [Pseudoalteromonas aurantia 208]|uniref:Uncharacterized protein n=1 Tax=Pseudoalteromonas aurantia 208 TaxID=1314867 RepID=A0ABR9EBQ3_9GAMM|nr:hypothetical protein [Pseudoalteromonas aurantia 208]